MKKRQHNKPLGIIRSVFLIVSVCIMMCSQAFALYPVHDSPAAVQRISQWMTAIDDLYTGYDHTMQLMKQLEQSYKSIQFSIEQAKNWKFDDIHWDGDIDIRDEMHQAYASINRQLNNIENIKYQLNDRQFKIGKGSYTIANIYGLVPWNSFQSMDKDALNHKTADYAIEDWLADTFNDPCAAVYKDLTKNMTDEEVDAALRKHGISAGAQDVVESTINWVKDDIAYIMGESAKSVEDMQKEQQIMTNATNSIVNPEEGVDQTTKQIEQKQALQIQELNRTLWQIHQGLIKTADLYVQARTEDWIRMRQAEQNKYSTQVKSGENNFTAVNDATWIDSPVMEAISYFSNTIWYFLTVARILGIIIGILGIVWCCIQVIFGTMEIQKALIGTISKWVLFIFIINVYPAACKHLLKFATSLGQDASGNTMNTISTQLGNYLNNLTEVVDSNIDSMNKLINASDSDASFSDYVRENYMTSSSSYLIEGTSQYENEFSSMKRKAKQDMKQKLQKYLEGHPDHTQRTVAALKTILVKDSNGNFKLDLSMKNSDGKDTGYLSPAAMMRLAVLTSSFMWERQFVGTDAAVGTDGKTTYKAKDSGGFGFELFSVKKIFQILLCLICMLCIIVSMTFTLCQYVSAIVEWAVISSFAVVLVPCMLWDGLKDMANKILPAMLAQAVKLTMITMCMLFAVWCYYQMGTDTIINGDIDMSTVGYIFFTCVLTFMLTQSAPKLASTLLTGQPQMSMGEFVAAAGTIAAGANAGYRAAQFADKYAPAAARAGMNRLGDAAAIVGAGHAASEAAGGGLRGAAASFAGGAAEAGSRARMHFTSSLARKAHQGMGGGAGGMGGGGTGENRFQHYDKNVINPESATAYGEAGRNVYAIDPQTGKEDKNRILGKEAFTAKEYLASQAASSQQHGADIGKMFAPKPHESAKNPNIPAQSSYDGLDYNPPKMLPPPKK